MTPGKRLIAAMLRVVPERLVWRFASSYIAGESLDDAVETIRALNADGCSATLDVLGEGVASHEEVAGYVDEYKRAVSRIAELGLDANVSVKPTAMGIHLSADKAFEAIREILDVARAHRMRVRLDLEDSSVTQATLDLHERLRHEGYDNAGVVIQAYLRRTLGDARALAAMGASVRVCKGIYVEPRRLAYKEYGLIRHAFVDALDALLRAPSTHVAIATHDEWLVFHGRRLLRELGVPRERYEFQMLLGVDRELRQLIVDEGHPLRVYVPYGRGWYKYSVRRLLENPRFASHVVKNVLGFGPESRSFVRQSGGKP